MGWGRIRQKEAGFTPGVELCRFVPQGDRWFIRVRITNEDYRIRSLNTEDLAEASKKAFSVWQSISEEVASSSSKRSIIKLFHLFLSSQQEKVDRGLMSPRTFDSKKSSIINGIIPYLTARGMQDPRRINSSKDFRTYSDWRLDQGKQSSTINNEITIIKEAFKWMRREEFIDYDPPFIESLPMNQAKRDQSNPPIPVSDYGKISDWLNTYCEMNVNDREKYARYLFRASCLIRTTAALRPHEWRALTYGMVEIGNPNEISIPYWCKTGSRLVVCVTDQFSILKNKQLSYGIEITKATFLSINPDTGNSMSSEFYTRRWKRMMKELKMKYTEYSLRATGICIRLEAGTPVFTVAKWAGQSVRVLEQYYTASIMRSERMKKQILQDTGEQWSDCGIKFYR